MVRAFPSLSLAFSSKGKVKESVEEVASDEQNVAQLFSDHKAEEASENVKVVASSGSQAVEEQTSKDAPEPVEKKAEDSGNARVKTTFLGFEGIDDFDDLDDEDEEISDAPATAAPIATFPTGWLVVADGPGRGASFALGTGVNGIGRGEDQTVCLDFGDNSISREGHVHVAYDIEDESFYVGHGGKSNLARLNGKPLLSTETLEDRDTIKIGQTTLLFIALCNDEFSWANDAE